MHLQIKREHLETMKKISMESYPVEACGILVGLFKQEIIEVTRIVHAKNQLESPNRFQIEPEFLLETINKAEKEGLELVGFFHSHPEDTTPSEIDERYMAYWIGYVWIIIPVRDGKIAAYFSTRDGVIDASIDINYEKH
jgi:proteasome lid subunit RPN8/RPN11